VDWDDAEEQPEPAPPMGFGSPIESVEVPAVEEETEDRLGFRH
jgi:hypothetical protein